MVVFSREFYTSDTDNYPQLPGDFRSSNKRGLQIVKELIQRFRPKDFRRIQDLRSTSLVNNSDGFTEDVYNKIMEDVRHCPVISFDVEEIDHNERRRKQMKKDNKPIPANLPDLPNTTAFVLLSTGKFRVYIIDFRDGSEICIHLRKLLLDETIIWTGSGVEDDFRKLSLPVPSPAQILDTADVYIVLEASGFINFKSEASEEDAPPRRGLGHTGHVLWRKDTKCKSYLQYKRAYGGFFPPEWNSEAKYPRWKQFGTIYDWGYFKDPPNPIQISYMYTDAITPICLILAAACWMAERHFIEYDTDIAVLMLNMVYTAKTVLGHDKEDGNIMNRLDVYKRRRAEELQSAAVSILETTTTTLPPEFESSTSSGTSSEESPEPPGIQQQKQLPQVEEAKVLSPKPDLFYQSSEEAEKTRAYIEALKLAEKLRPTQQCIQI